MLGCAGSDGEGGRGGLEDRWSGDEQWEWLTTDDAGGEVGSGGTSASST